MNVDALTEYRFLWDGSNPGWVLLKTSGHPSGYCVFNRIHSTLLHIESSEVKEAVCKKMKELGCEILEEVTPGPVKVTELLE